MAISNPETIASYLADGVTTSFPVPFPYRDEEDLLCTLVDANQNVISLVLNSDYTVAGVLDDEGLFTNGGTVSPIVPASWAAPLKLTITRRSPKTQATSYTANDKFPAKVNEAALDQVVMLVQEISRHFQGYADGFPSAGLYQKDDWFFIRNAGDFGYMIIICTVAGSPGTWKPAMEIGA